MAFPGDARARTCAEAVAEDESYGHFEQSAADDQPRSLGKDFDFVERPSEDFFCPVSLELLIEPQLTSCCGHHLSLEAATRLQREGKPCPMCNGEEWSAVLDKYHSRKAHEVRVRCWHKENGCEWVGEVNELKRHADSCVKRLWECQYCALKCTYREGKEKHWPTCSKFPEPCPNGCEVGSVERCNIEQHRSVCSLEPVACEMKEFGCSVVVPRKELAAHMRESELQHLTAMTMLNLCLSRQLQQDSTERDRKMAQLQQEQITMKLKMTEMQHAMKTTMNDMQTALAEEQKQLQKMEANLQDMMETKMQVQRQLVTEVVDKQKQMQRSDEVTDRKILQTQSDLTSKIEQLQREMVTRFDEQKQVFEEASAYILQQQLEHNDQVPTTSDEDEDEAAGLSCSGTEFFTFHYSESKESEEIVYSSPFYTHYEGYKLKLGIIFYGSDIGAELYLMEGEFDHQLNWPVAMSVRLELLNQAGDHHHVVRTTTCSWGTTVTSGLGRGRTTGRGWGRGGAVISSFGTSSMPPKTETERSRTIDLNIIKYSTLERKGGRVQYMMNDCLKFKVIVEVEWTLVL